MWFLLRTVGECTHSLGHRKNYMVNNITEEDTIRKEENNRI